jgi:hypothetical protein
LRRFGLPRYANTLTPAVPLLDVCVASPEYVAVMVCLPVVVEL